jgi:hypothetical protein
MYYDSKGKLRSMLTAWTSLAEPDQFAQAARGRSWFRVDDLLRLAAQVGELKGGGSARRVKQIMPLA